ncbi:hypothetical protein K449DRAFT_428420 [Hypoxylon sp. EC38]|nr:hypothetical protein K449DRAFT_428420 [Hypoxylon sp. EC38]
MENEIKQLLEHAERLKHRMVWLASDIERDQENGKLGSPRMKIQMFEGICSSLKAFSVAQDNHQVDVEFRSIIQRQQIDQSERRAKQLENELLEEKQTLEQNLTQVQMGKAQLEGERKQFEEEKASWIGGVFGNLNITADKTLTEIGNLRNAINVSSENAGLREQLGEASRETEVLRGQLKQAQGKVEETQRRVDEVEDSLQLSCNENTSLSEQLHESGTLLQEARDVGRTEKEKAERLEEGLNMATNDMEEAQRQLRVATDELQVLRLLQDQLSVSQNECQKLTSDRNALNAKVGTLDAQLTSLKEERDNATSKVEDLQCQIKELREQVDELEDAKVQLKTQMDKVQMQQQHNPPIDSRKRPRIENEVEEEEDITPNPWGDDVVRLSSFLHSCQPVLDADQSCSLDQAKIFIVLAALDTRRLELFLDFLTYAPGDKWFCFDELTEEGYEGGIAGINEGSDPQCARHAEQDQGSCFQVRNCNEGDVSYDRKFVCRIR